jgi:hypothetical protein
MPRKLTITIHDIKFSSKTGLADFRIEVDEKNYANDKEERVAAFHVTNRKGDLSWLPLLAEIVEKAPDCCQDFDVTHRRWAKEGRPYERRMSEWKAYCSQHSIGFPGYHIGYTEYKGKKERLFECSYCGCTFPESRGMECDER